MVAVTTLAMQRFLLVSIALFAGSCSRQPICKPWSPAGPAAASAPAAPPPPPDDGSTPVATASPEDAWNSVVGYAPEPASSASPARIAKAKPARRTAQAGDRAPAPAPKAAAPAPAADPARQPAPAPSPMLAEAKQFYAGRCVPCHGTSGRGDGPTGQALDPHPRNFTDRTWQASVTDRHIETVILQGGPSVGKSPLMPPHGDLSSKPELLAAMREVVRGFGR